MATPRSHQPAQSRAMLFAPTNDRRLVWVGLHATMAIMAGWIAPGFPGRAAWDLGEPQPLAAPADLFSSAPGRQTRGPRCALATGTAGLLFAMHLLAQRMKV